MAKNKNILLVAGEASGDLHGAHLIEQIKALEPTAKFYGIGGPKMAAAGMRLDDDLTKLAVVGFVEVLKNYFTFLKIFNRALQSIKETKPAAVILIDYPGFNLRLAKAIKKIKGLETRVIYYISPQVWAWKENRVFDIEKYVDKMLVLFEFEKEFYAKHGIDVEFVGHPLIDTVVVDQSKEEVLRLNNLPDYNLTIGILPGSREKEIRSILPVMLNAAKLLAQEFHQIQFLLIKAPTISKELVSQYLQGSNLKLRVLIDNTYDAINACDLCMSTSGTATLETAILQKPMVVIYKTSMITYALAKMFIKIPYIGMANVVAGKQIVPECVQFGATPKAIAHQLKSIFTNEIRVAEMKDDLLNVKRSLGGRGASKRAAEAILTLLS